MEPRRHRLPSRAGAACDGARRALNRTGARGETPGLASSILGPVSQPRGAMMIEDPTDFQLKFRVAMLERMALRAMIIAASHGRTLDQARQDSVAWLQSSTALANKIAGAARDDFALSELYDVEAREVIDDLIAETNALVKELEAGRKS